MLHIGCHLSSAKGFAAMGRDAVTAGADTFAFFTRNPRGGSAKALDSSDADVLNALCAERGFAKLVAHAPYTMNVCSADAGTRAFSRTVFAEDLKRMEYVPGNYYNFHPGSHVGQGSAAGIALIAEALAAVLPAAIHTVVLLETMAGKGSEVGGSFEELRSILDAAAEREAASGGSRFCADRLGVCLDTCHVHDAGYDIIGDLDGVLTRFDTCIGLNRLKAIHLNDSMNPAGSRKDRHALIGQGEIGADALIRVATHPALRELPFILETPTDLAGHAAEIAFLRAAVNRKP